MDLIALGLVIVGFLLHIFAIGAMAGMSCGEPNDTTFNKVFSAVLIIISLGLIMYGGITFIRSW